MPNSQHSIAGNVHDFVREWLLLILSIIHRHGDAHEKDWQLLEHLSHDEYLAYSRQSGSNVVSFAINKATKPEKDPFRHVYRAVSELVGRHCIDHQLTLPGFYAFLREMLFIEKTYPEAYAEDKRLKAGANALVTGYWEKVKPSLYDVTNGVSDDMTSDLSAIQGISQLIEEQSAGPSNDLDPRPPFQKQIQADLQQALGSRPSPTATLTR